MIAPGSNERFVPGARRQFGMIAPGTKERYERRGMIAPGTK